MSTGSDGKITKEISLFQYFKWGAKNHPGGAMYIFFIFMVWCVAMQNKNIASGIIAAGIVSVLFFAGFVLSSISVGRANRKLIMIEFGKQERDEG